MNVKIEGKELVIRIPMSESPTASKSGKSLVLATTSGNVRTSTTFRDKPITIGLNAYISAS
jgi:hypothetical protein